MPKILEDGKQKILAEAKKQTLTDGYAQMTIRSVAEACGIAVGTIYNYYSSKEVLVASFLLEDWFEIRDGMERECAAAATPSAAFACIHNGLEEFRGRYAVLLSDSAAEKSAGSAFRSRHHMLRAQLSALLTPICRRAGKTSLFLPDFLAEALLAWPESECSFDELNETLSQLFL